MLKGLGSFIVLSLLVTATLALPDAHVRADDCRECDNLAHYHRDTGSSGDDATMAPSSSWHSTATFGSCPDYEEGLYYPHDACDGIGLAYDETTDEIVPLCQSRFSASAAELSSP